MDSCIRLTENNASLPNYLIGMGIVAILVYFMYRGYCAIFLKKSGTEVLFNVQSLNITVNNNPDSDPAVNTTEKQQVVKRSSVNLGNSSIENVCVVNEPIPSAEPEKTTVEAMDDGGVIEIENISKFDFQSVVGQCIKGAEAKYGVFVKYNPDQEKIAISGSNATNRQIVKNIIFDKIMVKITLPSVDSTTWNKLKQLKTERKITILESPLVDGQVQSVTFQGLPRFCRQFIF